MSSVKLVSWSGIVTAGRATNVPRPTSRVSRPRRTSSSIARRAVMRDTPVSSAS
ncbi:MAG: hypothetical protein PGN24_12205 [Microbacterium arborescens]